MDRQTVQSMTQASRENACTDSNKYTGCYKMIIVNAFAPCINRNC